MIFNIKHIVCGLVYISISIVNASPVSKLPKGFIQCKLSDPNFDVCLKDAVQSSLRVLANGYPSLNLTKFDPLHVSNMNIKRGTGPINIELIFRKMVIFNVHHIVANKVHYDPVNYNFTYEFHVPKPIIIDSEYTMNGKILLLPITGKGKCTLTNDISKYTGYVINKLVERAGEKYLEIEKLSWKYIIIKMKTKFDNLFNGHKALGDSMNDVLNENWRLLSNEIQPIIEDNFSSVFKDIIQQFFSRIPLNQIFLD